ncbi:hypothetical protein DPX16_5591 [Anabarilius grahami]|uniref:Uncharacterized protein n=1 Tax=Anabarilius grahami TaxID=495550 RepID=A0A3N0YB94_ANAGA|nr:hypothetical protein DPX16_5591 [Anabarilius grahami]
MCKCKSYLLASVRSAFRSLSRSAVNLARVSEGLGEIISLTLTRGEIWDDGLLWTRTKHPAREGPTHEQLLLDFWSLRAGRDKWGLVRDNKT